MSTTARHRRPSPVGWLAVIGSALLGIAVGAGGVIIARPSPPTHQASPQQAPTANTATSEPASPRPAETVRAVDPIAFAPPATNAVGISMTVLRPEKVKGGVRFTIALVNTNDIPITVDTGALGPHDPRFNDASVPMAMTPVRKKLVPGEGYTYQCVFTLPTMDVGHVAFAVGTMNVAGQVAGD